MSKAQEAQDPFPSSNGSVKAEAQHTQDSSGISSNGSVKAEAQDSQYTSSSTSGSVRAEAQDTQDSSSPESGMKAEAQHTQDPPPIGLREKKKEEVHPQMTIIEEIYQRVLKLEEANQLLAKAAAALREWTPESLRRKCVGSVSQLVEVCILNSWHRRRTSTNPLSLSSGSFHR